MTTPSVELIEALRTYAPRFAASRDAVADVEFGDAIGEQTPVYGRDLYNAETFVGERLARLVVAHDPLLERTELEQALRQSEEQRKLVLEADQRRAVAVAKAPAEDGGAHAQRIVVESAARLGAQVLTPQHASAVGVAALNRVLQARLNPAAPSKPEVEVSSELIFRLGDRVIVGKNNYKTLCFNGETGEIVDISPEALELRLEDAQGERRVVYDRDDWWQLQLAYAVTNHRAQGSEWPNVIVVVSQSHYLMLQRNLVYTALTRARKRAVIVVSGGLTNKRTGAIFRSALEVAVANDEIDRRYSGLTERLERAVAVLGSSASSGDSTVHSGTAVSRG